MIDLLLKAKNSGEPLRIYYNRSNSWSIGVVSEINTLHRYIVLSKDSSKEHVNPNQKTIIPLDSIAFIIADNVKGVYK